MITTITLTTRTHGGWIARLPDQSECFVPESQVQEYAGYGVEFTAVILPNKRDYPQWFCHRLRPVAWVTPDDVANVMNDLPSIGYSHAAELGYADGQCDKIISLRNGKTVDGGSCTWYVDDMDNYTVQEID